MKRIFTLLTCLTPFTFYAQDLVLVTFSNSYKEMAFYKLTEENAVNVANTSWDMAFTAFGTADAGIHLNEAAELNGNELQLFLAPTNNFDNPVNPANLGDRLYNDEISWNYGAFNANRLEVEPDDFGWGIYDPGTGKIEGTTVYVLKFRNGTYKKLQIVSLDQNVYTLKHADLDGANETTLTIDKADYADGKFAFLSLSTGQTLSTVPDEWDLLFTRYAVSFDDGMGGLIYMVTSGTLSGLGVEVAQADGVDPATVEFTDFQDSLSTVLDVIGWDWKTFNLSSGGWSLPDDRAYFVKTANGDVWKIVFQSFGGSSTGNAIFEKTLVGNVSAVENSPVFTTLDVFPNPSSNGASVTFSMKNAGVVKLSLVNLLGQVVWTGKTQATAGFNAVELNGLNVPPGAYFLKLQANGATATVKLSRA